MKIDAMKTLSELLSKEPEDVIAIYREGNGGIGVHWSTMPLEQLVYLSQVLQEAIRSRLSQQIGTADYLPVPPPAPQETAPVASEPPKPKSKKAMPPKPSNLKAAAK